MKKILVLGGTGAMGMYLVPELIGKGYAVDVVSLDEKTSDTPFLNYIKADAFDDEYIKALMENGYNAVVDFLIYPTEKFKTRHPLFLENTEQYIYLSSYRVYANVDKIITENSPRLLDVSTDREYLATDEYALQKARGEDILRSSKYKNWTIVRPAVTYSKFRYQLISLEANATLPRVFEGKPILLPKEALSVQGTMTWAGDVAKMIAALVLNPKSYCEAYTVSTAEHHTWETIAGYYHELTGLEYEAIPADEFLKYVYNSSIWNTWQLKLDRLYDRVIDNSKILEISGFKQSDLMPLKEGLKRELAYVDKNTVWIGGEGARDGMEKYFNEHRS